MATSSFTRNIVLTEEGAKKFLKLLEDAENGEYPPRPNVDGQAEIKRGEDLLEKYALKHPVLK